MNDKLSIQFAYDNQEIEDSEYIKIVSGNIFWNNANACFQDHWNDDYVYSSAEIQKISRLCRQYKLIISGVHASAGAKDCWYSPNSCDKGVQLIINRMYLANAVSANAITLHPCYSFESGMDVMKENLKKLLPIAQDLGIKIALENLCDWDAGLVLDELFVTFPGSNLGLCFDSGHANICNGISILEKHKDRLLDIHLHDNNGEIDEHRLPFEGTADWKRIIRAIKSSLYRGEINLEVNSDRSLSDDDFLTEAYRRAIKLLVL